MKRKLLAIALLSMLLGTSGVIFAQWQYASQEQQIIASVQEFVKNKGETHSSIIRQSDVLDALLALLAQGLFIAGLLTLVIKISYSYRFRYTQASARFSPQKEKDLRFAWDDVL